MFALAVAEEAGVAYDAVLYMKKANHPGRAAFERLVRIVEDPVEDLVRKDSKFKKLGLSPDDYIGNASAVVDILDQQPTLLQRPVIVKGGAAIIGRPRDRVALFLK